MIINLSDNADINLALDPWKDEGLTFAAVGNKGAGKSNTLAVIAEEFHRNRIPFIHYDPDGDAASLRELGNDVIVIGDPAESGLRQAHYSLDMGHDQAGDFVQWVLDDGFSLVVDMTERDGMIHPLEVFIALAKEHFRQANFKREPCAILVDEASEIAPQNYATKLQKESKKVLKRINSNGRKRGMVLATATQRTTFVDKDILFAANLRFFGKFTWEPDYDKIKHYVPATFDQMKALLSGQGYLSSNQRLGFTRIKMRRTTDLGKTPAFVARPERARPDVQQLQFKFVDQEQEAR